jgi:hypothetical protein
MAFLLAAWLAASKAGHARFSFVDGRGDHDPVRLSIAGPQHTPHIFIDGIGSNDARRRPGIDDARGVGLVEAGAIKTDNNKEVIMFDRKCDECNMSFTSVVPWARFCCDAHKMKAYRRRRDNKEKVIQRRPAPTGSPTTKGKRKPA